jgi:hypothetical protein
MGILAQGALKAASALATKCDPTKAVEASIKAVELTAVILKHEKAAPDLVKVLEDSAKTFTGNLEAAKSVSGLAKALLDAAAAKDMKSVKPAAFKETVAKIQEAAKLNEPAAKAIVEGCKRHEAKITDPITKAAVAHTKLSSSTIVTLSPLVIGACQAMISAIGLLESGK